MKTFTPPGRRLNPGDLAANVSSVTLIRGKIPASPRRDHWDRARGSEQVRAREGRSEGGGEGESWGESDKSVDSYLPFCRGEPACFSSRTDFFAAVSLKEQFKHWTRAAHTRTWTCCLCPHLFAALNYSSFIHFFSLSTDVPRRFSLYHRPENLASLSPQWTPRRCFWCTRHISESVLQKYVSPAVTKGTDALQVTTSWKAAFFLEIGYKQRDKYVFWRDFFCNGKGSKGSQGGKERCGKSSTAATSIINCTLQYDWIHKRLTTIKLICCHCPQTLPPGNSRLLIHGRAQRDRMECVDSHSYLYRSASSVSRHNVKRSFLFKIIFTL